MKKHLILTVLGWALLLATAAPCLASADADARAAWAWQAPRPPQAPPAAKDSCGDPACPCGCNDGLPCACATGKAAPKTFTATASLGWAGSAHGESRDGWTWDSGKRAWWKVEAAPATQAVAQPVAYTAPAMTFHAPAYQPAFRPAFQPMPMMGFGGFSGGFGGGCGPGG